MLIPDVPDSEEARDVHISHERATQIIDYLSKYEWASAEHIVFYFCYHTGLRRGALHGLDADDWQSGDRELEHVEGIYVGVTGHVSGDR